MLNISNEHRHSEVTIDQLQTAIDHEQFMLVYQPIVRLEDNQIVQAEALLRWQHPVLGMLSPDQFLPLCEHTGMIHSLGRWVLHAAAHQLKRWHALGHTSLSVSVNLSVNQLNDPDFLALIINILTTNEISPHCLQLEITEHYPMQNLQHKKSLFKTLQNLGLQLSLDDFGMGYASLHYLQHLAFNSLKIDKTFIADLSTNPVSHIIVESMITLGKKLGLTLIAEGVESAEQLAILKSMKCDMVQGYLYSKPVEAEKFRELIAL